MVEKPKRTGSPVVGCCQVRAASASIAAFSSPLAGGAANSWPMTEKRRCAHRSWTRRLRACSVMSALLSSGATSVEHTAERWRRASSAGWPPFSSVHAAPPVIGPRSAAARSADRRVTGEALEQRGRQLRPSTGGMKRGAATFQNRVAVKPSRHHLRQRSTVRRDATSSQPLQPRRR